MGGALSVLSWSTTKKIHFDVPSIFGMPPQSCDQPQPINPPAEVSKYASKLASRGIEVGCVMENLTHDKFYQVIAITDVHVSIHDIKDAAISWDVKIAEFLDSYKLKKRLNKRARI